MRTLGKIAALFLCIFSVAATAQDYPTKPITLIVPYAAGGGNDAMARIAAEKMSRTLGQQIVIENRGGAGGTIATRQIAKSEPDGYTLGIGGTGTLAIGPTLYGNVGYDPRKDFSPIGLIGTSALVVLVHPSMPVKSIAELIAYAKANPGKLNFASAGIGTAPHLAGELVKLRTGIDMTHVPYRGIGPAYPDVMSGKVQMAFSSIAGALPFTTDKRVLPLATTRLQRSAVYPDVPTIAESGLPGFDVDLWLAVYGPAGIPPDVLNRLNAALNKTLEHAEMKAALAKVGVEPRGTSVEESVALNRAEYEKWKKVIIDGKLKGK